jgi:hypothetical protein
MADEADRAEDSIDAMLNAAINKRHEAGPKATGRCLWCGVKLPPGRRWCDAECRDDWEVHAKRRR